MPAAQLGAHFKAARKALRWSQRDVAESVGVSERLVREFERGLRPNLSVDTAFRLLAHVGVSIQVEGHGAFPSRVYLPDMDAQSMAARAQIRRVTWRGAQTRLSSSEDEPTPPRSRAQRMASVAQVSALAYALATTVSPKRKGARAR